MILLHKKMSSHLFCSVLRFSTINTNNPSPKPHFIVDYLINSCGLSPERANKASKYLAHLKSPSNADSVLNFLRTKGFDDTQIRSLISFQPRILCSNVDKTLNPKFLSLLELGFSQSDLIQLVSRNPIALTVRDLRPKIEFWRSFLGTNENLLRVMGKHGACLDSSLGKTTMPNISLLRGCGLSDNQIQRLMATTSYIMKSNPEIVKAKIEQVEGLGLSRGSGMFYQVLISVSANSTATLNSKIKLLKSLGWSEADVMSAFKKQPDMMRLSEKNISRKMHYLVNEVSCDISYLVSHPRIFTCSLERTVVPRYAVLKTLKTEGLLEGRWNPLSVFISTEKRFIEKFVVPHEKVVRALYETYVIAAAANKDPSFQSDQVFKEE